MNTPLEYFGCPPESSNSSSTYEDAKASWQDTAGQHTALAADIESLRLAIEFTAPDTNDDQVSACAQL